MVDSSVAPKAGLKVDLTALLLAESTVDPKAAVLADQRGDR